MSSTEKQIIKFNPTAHFPPIDIGGNTFCKKRTAESMKPIHTNPAKLKFLLTTLHIVEYRTKYVRSKVVFFSW